jgi:hypothetical protein
LADDGKKESDRGYWLEVGAAWPHKDGKGFDLTLSALPTDGRLDEHLTPLRVQRVGRDNQALVLVALGDQLEQHRCLGLVAPHVAQIVQDQRIEAIELGELLRQKSVAD